MIKMSKLTYPTFPHYLKMIHIMNGMQNLLNYMIVLNLLSYWIPNNDKEHYSQKSPDKKTSCKYAHLFFCQPQNSKFQRAETTPKIMESEFPGHMHISMYTLCPNYINTYKVSTNFCSGLKRICAYKLFITLSI